MAVGVDLVCVGHVPCATGAAVVIRYRLEWCSELGLVCVESVAVFVFRTANFTRSSLRIDLEYCVLRTVNVRVYSQTKQMLVIVSVDAGIHLCTPTLGVLSWVHGVCVQDAGKLDLELNSPILVEDPVNTVLIVCSCEDVGDKKLSASSNNDRVVTEISVLEQDASILFVYTYGILNRLTSTGAVDEIRVHIVNSSLAVAAQSKTIGHIAASIFAKVKGMLPLMRVLGIAVGYDHFSHRKSVEDSSLISFVVVCDIVENDTFPVVEANVDLPVLPLNDPTIHFERHTFGLCDIDGLQIFSVATLGFDSCWMVVVRRCLIDGSPYWRNVDVNDLLGVAVENWGEV